MTMVGFHASHEQAAPTVLLEAVRAAEEAGFDAAMCSDHLAPWSERLLPRDRSWNLRKRLFR
jgi:alkanesulfonate monooxygenase SsuD/methylene tetrahydromethanopterin reductase-like flavin-dependent oxidoreductase (luciferase family)